VRRACETSPHPDALLRRLSGAADDTGAHSRVYGEQLPEGLVHVGVE
jgi:hypothetical protein